jgi:hypothetical protein
MRINIQLIVLRLLKSLKVFFGVFLKRSAAEDGDLKH